jgi:hypothetical protein
MQARLDALVAQRTRIAAATLAVAESGLEHALADLADDPRFTRLGMGPDGRAGGGDDGDFPFADSPDRTGAYRYEVRVTSSTADRAEIVARGFGPFGAVRGVAASVLRGATPQLAAALAAEAAQLSVRLDDGWLLAGAAGLEPGGDVPALALADGVALPDGAGARLSGPGAPSLRRRPPPVVRALIEAVRQRGDAVRLAPLTDGALGSGLFFASGPLRLSQASGSGILVVDGALEVDGATSFSGVLVVDGDVRVAAGAALNVEGGVLQGPRASLLQLLGSGTVRYDPRIITALGAAWPELLPRPARVTGWRELAEVTP